MKLSTSNNKTNQELTDQELTDQEQMDQELTDQELMDQELTDFLDQQDSSELKKIKEIAIFKFHKYKSLMLQDKKLHKEKKLLVHQYIVPKQHQKEQLMVMQHLEVIQICMLVQKVITQMPSGKLI